jgi:CheY-like chemotaxis protein
MQASQAPPRTVDVLIAADDAALRAGLRLLLEGQGMTCAEAENGGEALDLARSSRPRCVLLDLTIPGLDGLTVARRLRADPRTRTARIHCLTGRSDPAVRQQARGAGCEGFLLKPVDPDTLLRAVGAWAAGPVLREVPGLTKTEAEDLLDWLEAHGVAQREVLLEGTTAFTVRWVEAI